MRYLRKRRLHIEGNREVYDDNATVHGQPAKDQYSSSNYTELMPLPWKPVQRLVNTDIVLAFDQFLGISEALHTDLDTAIMIAGIDWDESTSTSKQLDEALLPLEVSRQGPGPLISELVEIDKRWI
ncbi:putative Werner syndrome ATP-dependent helicase like protein [Fusarium oxysporum f. sp. albedinis]|nr:putative Werner syndrome ATP-dependent helicase like protein [Fusarium oxysporum f. sp. albedinis]